MRWMLGILAMGILGGNSLPTHADRDIVYAARYYNAPGSRGTSHVHLYRINPDGTGRTRLTSGSGDDSQPQWSPDGNYLAFVRITDSPTLSNSVFCALCMIPARGGKIRVLHRYDHRVDYRWTHNGKALFDGQHVIPLSGSRRDPRIANQANDGVPSPNGRYIYSNGDGTDDPGTLIDRPRGRKIPTQIHLDSPLWLDDHQLVGAVDTHGDTPGICVIGSDGKILHRSRLHLVPPTSKPEDTPGGGHFVLQAIPGDTNHVGWWGDISNSTIRPDWVFYQADAQTGGVSRMGEGQFLAWSPDGSRYCTANRSLIPFSKRKDGTTRVVWGASLMMVNPRNGTAKNITPGKVLVEEAAWRQSGHHRRPRR